MTVSNRSKSVEKAKASSVPVDLRERFFDAFGDNGDLTSILPFSALLDLPATCLSNSTSKTGIRDRPLRPLGQTDTN